ncbi:MAG: amidohydrolase family protein [Gammaproteobacteria bacterium]|nr:amidohydrolase family protein [Gammaproteobacteria bacterium]
MPYISDRTVHDADSHVMEIPHWLDEFATKRVATEFNKRLGSRESDFYRNILGKHDAANFSTDDEDRVMGLKNHEAIGAFRKADRSLAVDLMGVASQLIFPTSTNVWLETLEHGDDLDLLYETASGTNRSQMAFCGDDARLIPVGYVPLADIDRAIATAAEALAIGVKALLIPWACPRDHATSHIKLDALWAQATEAQVPILLHVGLADRVLPAAHKNNGLPAVPDFHGGEENFRSISYMAIPHGPMQALSMLILDGVLDRFEDLKIGVIELGATWVPGFMRQLDAALEAFGRHETRLQSLKLKPSDYVRRQVRVTPYPTEPTGWIIEQSAPEICMFSSDYPHLEGGRNPYGRFLRTTEELSEPVRDRFFRANFEDLLGPQVFPPAAS